MRFPVLLCLVGFLGAGCIFSPDKGGKVVPPPIVYTKRDTPQNTIRFLTEAWENKDSVQVGNAYADIYTGSSVDLTDPTPTTLPFTKSDEVHAVHWLAMNTEITYLDMEYNAPSTWQEVRYANDPSDWVTYQIPHFKIQVLEGVSKGYVADSGAFSGTWFFEFTLRPTGPPSDTLWEIVRWVESRG